MKNKFSEMQSIVDFNSWLSDFYEIEELDFKEDVRIKVFSDIGDLFAYNGQETEMEGTIFSIWLEFGKEKEKTIMIETPINELELFAHSIIKQIDIIRKEYGDHIKIQSAMGNTV